MSIGVACFPDDARDPIRLVELADSALYRAKRNGRNVTCAYRHSLALNEGPLRPDENSRSDSGAPTFCNEPWPSTCKRSDDLICDYFNEPCILFHRE